MNEKNIDSKELSVFQKINHYAGFIVNGVEVSILVFCVAIGALTDLGALGDRGRPRGGPRRPPKIPHHAPVLR